MLITGIVVFVLLFLVGYLFSHGFRRVADQFWSSYIARLLELAPNLLKYGWPYAAIYVIYELINSGRLADTLREIAGH
jgi:hypothetical protein